MRRFFGVLMFLVGAAATYCFATWGAMNSGQPGLWGPFRGLGADYPADVFFAAAAAWTLALGLYFVLTVSKPALPAFDGRGTSRYHASVALHRMGSPACTAFMLNGLFLATALFAAYVGAKVQHPSGYVSVFFAVAALQAVFGFFLLIMALVEKPKSLGALLLGLVSWLGGTGVAVLAVLLGLPK
jgi:hypothetical protein